MVAESEDVKPARKSASRPSFLLGGLSRLTDEASAKTMARQAGVAGVLLVISEAVGVVFTYIGIDPTTFKVIPKMDFQSVEFYASAVFCGVLLLILAFMSWRTYVGKGYVSSALLCCLLLYEAYTKTVGGTLNAGWGIVYVGLAISLVGGVRAAWHLGRLGKQAAHSIDRSNSGSLPISGKLPD